MPENDSIHIKVTHHIPAPKHKVIRLLTRVDEFPSYVPTVKEASVLEKRHNMMKTKWHVQVDGISIRWIEEDILALRENSIYFKAIEGDLSEFRGEWKFRDVPDGTEVSVDVYLKMGIPGIKEFADAYMKKVLTTNFEGILRALERRSISLRYAAYRRGDIEQISGFGIIGHLYNYYHLANCLKSMNPDLKMPSREFLGKLFHTTPSFKLYDILNFKSKTGEVSNGCFIVATFIPDMIEKDIWTIFSKVVMACKIAEKHGIGIVTLGGFTSIVAERIGHEISKEVDVAVTTGNTFTAAMTIDGVLKAAKLLDLDISKIKVAIIGGTGDIGSACARVLADKVKEVAITGRTKSHLRSLRGELSKKRKARIIATTNNQKAVKDADIVIAAASATSSILSVDWFKPGSIICDVGYPKNISYAKITRDDILVFSGGLAKTPTTIKIPIDIGLPSDEVKYGCFCEAIILSLEKRYENFSFGRGNITSEKIEEISALGKKHGFEVSDFYWGDKRIDESIIERVKSFIRR